MNNKVKLRYIATEWTTGDTYAEGCEMCQDNAQGLYRMIPLPTIKVELRHEEQVGIDHHTYTRECYLCKGCIDRGVKTGQLEVVNPEPAGCPFAM